MLHQRVGALSPFFLPRFSRGAKARAAPGVHKHAEIRSDVRYTKSKKTGGDGGAAIIEGKMINLSIETKVAIAVATGFLMLIMGAMAQG